MRLASIRGGAGVSTTPTDWQRDGGAKHIIGIIMPFGSDEPFGIAAKALRCALREAPGEHIRISTRKRHAIEGRESGSRPPLMSLLLGLVRPIDERCKNLDEEMVAPKAEGRGLRRHARGCASELVSEDGATRRDSGLHCLDEHVDASAIERRKPAGL